jgi:hypothetical protein
MRRLRPVGLALLFLVAATPSPGCRKDPQKDDRTEKERAKADPDETPKKKKADKDEITFTKRVPAVGTVAEEKQSMEMKMELTLDMKGSKPITVEIERSETQVKREKVLASDGKVTTKLEVTYVSKEEIDKEKGTEKKKSSPVSGKVYRVEAKDGKPYVTTDKGGPVPPNEAAVVAKGQKSIGKPDPVFEGMPDTPIKVGDKVDSLAKAIKERLSEDTDDGEVTEVSVKLKEIRSTDAGKEGVFEVAMTLALKKKGDPLDLRMELTGTMVLRKDDTWPTELTLAGPITMSSAEGKGKSPGFTGKGTMKMAFSMSYPSAP